MDLEIGAIERSRSVDSQAWYFFFLRSKNRDVRADRNHGKSMKIIDFFVQKNR